MTNYKKLIITSIAAFTVLTTSAFAATGTAEKKVGSSSSVESVSIQGDGGNGTHYTRLSDGSGKGTGKLYEFVRFWPDKLINTHSISSSSGITYQETTFATNWDSAYNVVANGDSKAGIKTSVVIN